VKSRFGPFGDSVNVGARLLHGLRQMYHGLEIVLILTQDRCMVCTERTIGSEIIFDTPDGTPW
jgi:hypothetical protein